MRKIAKGVLYFFLALIILVSAIIIIDIIGWDSATRESARIAPNPEEHSDAVVQVYAAELWGFRGMFADHMWIATKQKNALAYTVYEVIGWRLSEGYDTSLRIAEDIPDRKWYGAVPRVLVNETGAQAEMLIKEIQAAAMSYPYPKEYSAFGPNSNTFIAWVLCKVPNLNLTLTRRAVGKNYLNDGCSG